MLVLNGAPEIISFSTAKQCNTNLSNTSIWGGMGLGEVGECVGNVDKPR